VAATLWPSPSQRPLSDASLFLMMTLCVLALVQVILLSLHAWQSFVAFGFLCPTLLLPVALRHAYRRLDRSMRLCEHYAAASTRHDQLVELTEQRLDVCALVASRLRVAFLDA